MTPQRLLRHARLETVALGQNAAHQFAARQALCIYRSNAIYSFIPKNACSTFRLSIAVANGVSEGAQDLGWIHNNNPTFAADLRDLARADYTFIVLRDPLQRLASVFLDKMVGKTVEMWALHKQDRESFDPDLLTFRAFVDIVDRPGFRRANIHWRPQVDFLVYERYDDYFRFEALSAAAPTLRQRAGLELIDARPLTRHGSDRFALDASICFADTPALHIAAMQRAGNSPAHLALYDDALHHRVSQLYRDDLDLLASLPA